MPGTVVCAKAALSMTGMLIPLASKCSLALSTADQGKHVRYLFAFYSLYLPDPGLLAGMTLNKAITDCRAGRFRLAFYDSVHSRPVHLKLCLSLAPQDLADLPHQLGHIPTVSIHCQTQNLRSNRLRLALCGTASFLDMYCDYRPKAGRLFVRRLFRFPWPANRRGSGKTCSLFIRLLFALFA